MSVERPFPPCAVFHCLMVNGVCMNKEFHCERDKMQPLNLVISFWKTGGKIKNLFHLFGTGLRTNAAFRRISKHFWRALEIKGLLHCLSWRNFTSSRTTRFAPQTVNKFVPHQKLALSLIISSWMLTTLRSLFCEIRGERGVEDIEGCS